MLHHPFHLAPQGAMNDDMKLFLQDARGAPSNRRTVPKLRVGPHRDSPAAYRRRRRENIPAGCIARPGPRRQAWNGRRNPGSTPSERRKENVPLLSVPELASRNPGPRVRSAEGRRKKPSGPARSQSPRALRARRLPLIPTEHSQRRNSQKTQQHHHRPNQQTRNQRDRRPHPANPPQPPLRPNPPRPTHPPIPHKLPPRLVPTITSPTLTLTHSHSQSTRGPHGPTTCVHTTGTRNKNQPPHKNAHPTPPANQTTPPPPPHPPPKPPPKHPGHFANFVTRLYQFHARVV
jgi:hypothetical protein